MPLRLKGLFSINNNSLFIKYFIMKTLAQQYQVLKNTIETIGRNCYFSMSTINKETIALVCEKLTLDFCEALPKDFEYDAVFHQSDVEVDIIANVKGDNKTFSVTTGMIERLGTNDCYFAKRLASYKESLNIEALSENAQKLRLEKQEVAKEEEQQEVKSNTIIDAMNKLQKEYPNFNCVKLFFGNSDTHNDVCDHYTVMVGEDAKHITQYEFAVKPSDEEVEKFNSLYPDYDCFFILFKSNLYIKRKVEPIQEEQQEVEEQEKQDLYSDIGDIEEDLDFFYDKDKIAALNSFNLNSTLFRFQEKYNLRLSSYNEEDFTTNTFGMLHIGDIQKLIKLGMYIERRNQLNKK